MALISCPECGRQISTAAEACPGCGYPIRSGGRPPAPASAAEREFQQKVDEIGKKAAAAKEPDGPRCYSCPRTATTRCQSCGAFSCAEHLQSIWVSHGKGGAYELRCQSCYESAQAWQTFGWVFGIIVFIIMLVIMGAIFGRRW
jgi:hypothetical protein